MFYRIRLAHFLDRTGIVMQHDEKIERRAVPGKRPRIQFGGGNFTDVIRAVVADRPAIRLVVLGKQLQHMLGEEVFAQLRVRVVRGLAVNFLMQVVGKLFEAGGHNQGLWRTASAAVVSKAKGAQAARLRA